jgi:hypothetical protein
MDSGKLGMVFYFFVVWRLFYFSLFASEFTQDFSYAAEAAREKAAYDREFHDFIYDRVREKWMTGKNLQVLCRKAAFANDDANLLLRPWPLFIGRQ